MLQNLIYFIVISFFCIAWGLPFIVITKSSNNRITVSLETLILSFFFGLALLSVIAAWISLLLPVHFWILCLLTLPLVFYELRWVRKNHFHPIAFNSLKEFSKPEWLFFIACLLLFSVLSTGKPAMEDTDLYHIQNIKWIHEYGTVTGLGNLYLRYGFYSNWFHAISLFQLPFAQQNFLYLNFSFCFWILFYLLYQYKSFQRNGTPAYKHLSLFYLVVLLFMLVEWDLFRIAASSTTYDFVVTAMVLICLQLLFNKLILKIEKKSEQRLLLILLIALPFFKLTGFLAAPLWLLLYIFSNNRKKLLLFSIGLALFCFIPFVIKNYVQTGYFFFPYQFFSIAIPEWQIPGKMVTLFNKYIYLSNHYINQSIPGFPFTDGATFSYYKDWFLHLVMEDRILIISCIVGLPLSLLQLKKIYGANFTKVLLIWLACIIALFVWLMASPDPRFAFGFLIFVSLFPLTGLFSGFMKPWMKNAFLYLFTVAVGFYTFQKGTKTFSLQNIVQPSAVDVPPYETVLINKVNYHIPHIINNNWNPRCLNTPLPCLYEQNPYLKPIDKKIKDGFKMTPYPDSAFIFNYYY